MKWSASEIRHFLITEAFQAQAGQLPVEDWTIVSPTTL